MQVQSSRDFDEKRSEFWKEAKSETTVLEGHVKSTATEKNQSEIHKTIILQGYIAKNETIIENLFASASKCPYLNALHKINCENTQGMPKKKAN